MPSTTTLAIIFGLFIVLGIPMVGYLWGTLNQLLSLQVNTTRLFISIPVLLLFIASLLYLRRTVERLSLPTQDNAGRPKKETQGD